MDIDPLQLMTQRGQAIQGKFQTPILLLRFLDPLKYLTKIDLTKTRIICDSVRMQIVGEEGGPRGEGKEKMSTNSSYKC